MGSEFPTRQLTKLTGHNGPVHAVTYSAGSGQYILTGSTDRTIRLFNPATSSLIQSFSAHGYEILGLAIAPDNASFASVGGDKLVFLWDTATAVTKRRWSGHGGRVNAVAFGGEDGGEAGGGAGGGANVVVSGSADMSVKVWDVRSGSGKALMSLEEAGDSVVSVKVSGAEIVAGNVDGRVRVYDVRMGVCSVDVVGHPVTSVTPTLQNDSLLVSSLDSTLRLFDKADGKLLQSYADSEFTNENYRIGSTLALKDHFVLSGSENGRILVWDHLTGKVVHKLRHGIAESGSSKKDVVSAVAFNEARKEWCSAGGDGNVVVWGSDR